MGSIRINNGTYLHLIDSRTRRNRSDCLPKSIDSRQYVLACLRVCVCCVSELSIQSTTLWYLCMIFQECVPLQTRLPNAFFFSRLLILQIKLLFSRLNALSNFLFHIFFWLLLLLRSFVRSLIHCQNRSYTNFFVREVIFLFIVDATAWKTQILYFCIVLDMPCAEFIYS